MREKCLLLLLLIATAAVFIKADSFNSAEDGLKPSLSCILWGDAGCQKKCSLLCIGFRCLSCDPKCNTVFCDCQEKLPIKHLGVIPNAANSDDLPPDVTFRQLMLIKFMRTPVFRDLDKVMPTVPDQELEVKKYLYTTDLSGKDLKQELKRRFPKLRYLFRRLRPRPLAQLDPNASAEILKEGINIDGVEEPPPTRSYFSSWLKPKPKKFDVNSPENQKRIIELIKKLPYKHDIVETFEVLRDCPEKPLYQNICRYFLKEGMQAPDGTYIVKPTTDLNDLEKKVQSDDVIRQLLQKIDESNEQKKNRKRKRPAGSEEKSSEEDIKQPNQNQPTSGNRWWSPSLWGNEPTPENTNTPVQNIPDASQGAAKPTGGWWWGWGNGKNSPKDQQSGQLGIDSNNLPKGNQMQSNGQPPDQGLNSGKPWTWPSWNWPSGSGSQLTNTPNSGQLSPQQNIVNNPSRVTALVPSGTPTSATKDGRSVDLGEVINPSPDSPPKKNSKTMKRKKLRKINKTEDLPEDVFPDMESIDKTLGKPKKKHHKHKKRKHSQDSDESSPDNKHKKGKKRKHSSDSDESSSEEVAPQGTTTKHKKKKHHKNPSHSDESTILETTPLGDQPKKHRKRKHHKKPSDDSSSDESTIDEITPSGAQPGKQKKKKKHHKRPQNDSDSDESSSEEIKQTGTQPKQKKRKHHKKPKGDSKTSVAPENGPKSEKKHKQHSGSDESDEDDENLVGKIPSSGVPSIKQKKKNNKPVQSKSASPSDTGSDESSSEELSPNGTITNTKKKKKKKTDKPQLQNQSKPLLNNDEDSDESSSEEIMPDGTVLKHKKKKKLKDKGINSDESTIDSGSPQPSSNKSEGKPKKSKNISANSSVSIKNLQSPNESSDESKDYDIPPKKKPKKSKDATSDASTDYPMLVASGPGSQLPNSINGIPTISKSDLSNHPSALDFPKEKGSKLPTTLADSSTLPKTFLAGNDLPIKTNNSGTSKMNSFTTPKGTDFKNLPGGLNTKDLGSSIPTPMNPSKLIPTGLITEPMSHQNVAHGREPGDVPNSNAVNGFDNQIPGTIKNMPNSITPSMTAEDLTNFKGIDEHGNPIPRASLQKLLENMPVTPPMTPKELLENMPSSTMPTSLSQLSPGKSIDGLPSINPLGSNVKNGDANGNPIPGKSLPTLLKNMPSNSLSPQMGKSSLVKSLDGSPITGPGRGNPLQSNEGQSGPHEILHDSSNMDSYNHPADLTSSPTSNSLPSQGPSPGKMGPSATAAAADKPKLPSGILSSLSSFWSSPSTPAGTSLDDVASPKANSGVPSGLPMNPFTPIDDSTQIFNKQNPFGTSSNTKSPLLAVPSSDLKPSLPSNAQGSLLNKQNQIATGPKSLSNSPSADNTQSDTKPSSPLSKLTQFLDEQNPLGIPDDSHEYINHGTETSHEVPSLKSSSAPLPGVFHGISSSPMISKLKNNSPTDTVSQPGVTSLDKSGNVVLGSPHLLDHESTSDGSSPVTFKGSRDLSDHIPENFPIRDFNKPISITGNPSSALNPVTGSSHPDESQPKEHQIPSLRNLLKNKLNAPTPYALPTSDTSTLHKLSSDLSNPNISSVPSIAEVKHILSQDLPPGSMPSDKNLKALVDKLKSGTPSNDPSTPNISSPQSIAEVKKLLSKNLPPGSMPSDEKLEALVDKLKSGTLNKDPSASKISAPVSVAEVKELLSDDLPPGSMPSDENLKALVDKLKSGTPSNDPSTPNISSPQSIAEVKKLLSKNLPPGSMPSDEKLEALVDKLKSGTLNKDPSASKISAPVSVAEVKELLSDDLPPGSMPSDEKLKALVDKLKSGTNDSNPSTPNTSSPQSIAEVKTLLGKDLPPGSMPSDEKLEALVNRLKSGTPNKDPSAPTISAPVSVAAVKELLSKNLPPGSMPSDETLKSLEEKLKPGTSNEDSSVPNTSAPLSMTEVKKLLSKDLPPSSMPSDEKIQALMDKLKSGTPPNKHTSISDMPSSELNSSINKSPKYISSSGNSPNDSIKTIPPGTGQSHPDESQSKEHHIPSLRNLLKNRLSAPTPYTIPPSDTSTSQKSNSDHPIPNHLLSLPSIGEVKQLLSKDLPPGDMPSDEQLKAIMNKLKSGAPLSSGSPNSSTSNPSNSTKQPTDDAYVDALVDHLKTATPSLKLLDSPIKGGSILDNPQGLLKSGDEPSLKPNTALNKNGPMPISDAINKTKDAISQRPVNELKPENSFSLSPQIPLSGADDTPLSAHDILQNPSLGKINSNIPSSNENSPTSHSPSNLISRDISTVPTQNSNEPPPLPDSFKSLNKLFENPQKDSSVIPNQPLDNLKPNNIVNNLPNLVSDDPTTNNTPSSIMSPEGLPQANPSTTKSGIPNDFPESLKPSNALSKTPTVSNSSVPGFSQPAGSTDKISFGVSPPALPPQNTMNSILGKISPSNLSKISSPSTSSPLSSTPTKIDDSNGIHQPVVPKGNALPQNNPILPLDSNSLMANQPTLSLPSPPITKFNPTPQPQASHENIPVMSDNVQVNSSSSPLAQGNVPSNEKGDKSNIKSNENSPSAPQKPNMPLSSLSPILMPTDGNPFEAILSDPSNPLTSSVHTNDDNLIPSPIEVPSTLKNTEDVLFSKSPDGRRLSPGISPSVTDSLALPSSSAGRSIDSDHQTPLLDNLMDTQHIPSTISISKPMNDNGLTISPASQLNPTGDHNTDLESPSAISKQSPLSSNPKFASLFDKLKNSNANPLKNNLNSSSQIPDALPPHPCNDNPTSKTMNPFPLFNDASIASHTAPSLSTSLPSNVTPNNISSTAVPPAGNVVVNNQSKPISNHTDTPNGTNNAFKSPSSTVPAKPLDSVTNSLSNGINSPKLVSTPHDSPVSSQMPINDLNPSLTQPILSKPDGGALALPIDKPVTGSITSNPLTNAPGTTQSALSDNSVPSQVLLNPLNGNPPSIDLPLGSKSNNGIVDSQPPITQSMTESTMPLLSPLKDDMNQLQQPLDGTVPLTNQATGVKPKYNTEIPKNIMAHDLLTGVPNSADFLTGSNLLSNNPNEGIIPDSINKLNPKENNLLGNNSPGSQQITGTPNIAISPKQVQSQPNQSSGLSPNKPSSIPLNNPTLPLTPSHTSSNSKPQNPVEPSNIPNSISITPVHPDALPKFTPSNPTLSPNEQKPQSPVLPSSIPNSITVTPVHPNSLPKPSNLSNPTIPSNNQSPTPSISSPTPSSVNSPLLPPSASPPQMPISTPSIPLAHSSPPQDEAEDSLPWVDDEIDISDDSMEFLHNRPKMLFKSPTKPSSNPSGKPQPSGLNSNTSPTSLPPLPLQAPNSSTASLLSPNDLDSGDMKPMPSSLGTEIGYSGSLQDSAKTPSPNSSITNPSSQLPNAISSPSLNKSQPMYPNGTPSTSLPSSSLQAPSTSKPTSQNSGSGSPLSDSLINKPSLNPSPPTFPPTLSSLQSHNLPLEGLNALSPGNASDLKINLPHDTSHTSPTPSNLPHFPSSTSSNASTPQNKPQIPSSATSSTSSTPSPPVNPPAGFKQPSFDPKKLFTSEELPDDLHSEEHTNDHDSESTTHSQNIIPMSFAPSSPTSSPPPGAKKPSIDLHKLFTSEELPSDLLSEEHNSSKPSPPPIIPPSPLFSKPFTNFDNIQRPFSSPPTNAPPPFPNFNKPSIFASFDDLPPTPPPFKPFKPPMLLSPPMANFDIPITLPKSPPPPSQTDQSSDDKRRNSGQNWRQKLFQKKPFQPLS